MLYTSTSDFFASARQASRAASFLRSSTIERLLRLVLRKMDPMPGFLYGQALRITSPSGDSTLITSAPKSPRICVEYGPITTEVRSRTRTPSSGPAIFQPLVIQLGKQLARLGRIAGAQHALRERLHLAEVGEQDALLDGEQLRRVHREVAQAQPEQQARQLQ